MNIQEPFTITTDLIQAKLDKMTTKAEMLAYLTSVGDFVGSTKKLVRAFLKGMR